MEWNGMNGMECGIIVVIYKWTHSASFTINTMKSSVCPPMRLQAGSYPGSFFL